MSSFDPADIAQYREVQALAALEGAQLECEQLQEENRELKIQVKALRRLLKQQQHQYAAYRNHGLEV